ncbi:MAG: 2OG-Fe(II) oxygenase [Acidimicrobiia bacterium]|nr:2OG-Fe(II) oxygenase [Acidimicrobiia bacterium]
MPSRAVLVSLAEAYAPCYSIAEPFSHAVFDGLIDPGLLRCIPAELPAHDSVLWNRWDTPNERRALFGRADHFGPATRQLAATLNGADFVTFLETLTGVDALLPDPHFNGGGVSRVDHGGFLNVHVDLYHNPRLEVVRQVNVLVYLNEDWPARAGGDLELWHSLDEGPMVKIPPRLGTVVVLSTPGAAHGHPSPLDAGPGRSRLCFSAYYYTSAAEIQTPAAGEHRVVFRAPPAPTMLRRAALAALPPVATKQLRRARRVYRRAVARRANGS